MKFFNKIRPTHMCRDCGAYWIQWKSGVWSLTSPSCEDCCDNVSMGKQIIRLEEALGGQS